MRIESKLSSSETILGFPQNSLSLSRLGDLRIRLGEEKTTIERQMRTYKHYLTPLESYLPPEARVTVTTIVVFFSYITATHHFRGMC